jgi:hypothetical protein
MRRVDVRLRRVVLALTACIAAAAMLAACGSQAETPQPPDFKMTATAGPKAGEATAEYRYEGVDGKALMALVLRRPDGTNDVLSYAQPSYNDSGAFTASDLPAGDYEFLLYARLGGQDVKKLTEGDYVPANLAASATVTVP